MFSTYQIAPNLGKFPSFGWKFQIVRFFSRFGEIPQFWRENKAFIRTRKLRQLTNWHINKTESLVSWLSCELTLSSWVIRADPFELTLSNWLFWADFITSWLSCKLTLLRADSLVSWLSCKLPLFHRWDCLVQVTILPVSCHKVVEIVVCFPGPSSW